MKNQLKQSIELLERHRQLRRDRKEQKLLSLEENEINDNFAFVAGYTSGGAPYGITHEEMDRIKKNNDLE